MPLPSDVHTKLLTDPDPAPQPRTLRSRRYTKFLTDPRLNSIEPVVYTAAQASEALQVSEDTIGRMVRRGVLPRVPHIDGKVLIPRRALDALVAGDQLASVGRPPGGASKRSMRSAAS